MLDQSILGSHQCLIELGIRYAPMSSKSTAPDENCVRRVSMDVTSEITHASAHIPHQVNESAGGVILGPRHERIRRRIDGHEEKREAESLKTAGENRRPLAHVRVEVRHVPQRERRNNQAQT